MFARGRWVTLSTVLLIAITSASADFHILNGTNGRGGYAAKTVPSNHYSCLGWLGASVIRDFPDIDSTVVAFSVGNLCGAPQLNFYNNGNDFDVYIDGGDGSRVGTCSPTVGAVSGSINGGSACPDGYAVFDGYTCMSYICN
ncbi:hypothetical protein TRAPUB_1984 [Trametes pubescens]|uniref:Uncharacterized protein n=1 Tax=Trametes pubescens TaxID=154538 RepID=A0A1M2VHV6_TRAPU|nr:hypothetical protein TRAPUB_1984 [Trametes pubescens]